jgi:hypothetical protein
MANYPNFIIFDPIIDLVRIADDRKRVDAGYCGCRGGERCHCKKPDLAL